MVVTLLGGALTVLFNADPLKDDGNPTVDFYEIKYVGVVNGEISEIPIVCFSETGYYPATYVEGSTFEIDELMSLASDEDYYYVFEGWYLDEDCVIPFDGITTETVGEVSLYADIVKRSAWTKYY